MSINVYNIEQAILDKMNSSSTELELLEYSKMLTQLKTGIVQVVDTYASLPTSSTSVGHLYYVQDEKTVYWANSDYGWITITTQTVNYLYSWGSNLCGKFGDGTTICTVTPTQEITTSNWCQVAKVNIHGSAIKTDGTVWSWGWNAYGGLGDNSTTNKSSPVQELTSSTNWCYISVGSQNATAGVKTNGTIWSWGSGECGEIGNNAVLRVSSPVQEITSSTNWCHVMSHFEHKSGIKTDGTLWLWGENVCGQLGLNDVINRSSPVQEITSGTAWVKTSSNACATFALKTDGTIWGWGNNSYSTNLAKYSSPVQEVSSSSNWCFISAGYHTVGGIKTDGTIWNWGRNDAGTLATNTSTNSNSPVQEFSSSTNWKNMPESYYWGPSAIKTDGTLWLWGYNNPIPSPANTNTSSPVQEVLGLTTWCQTAQQSAIINVSL